MIENPGDTKQRVKVKPVWILVAVNFRSEQEVDQAAEETCARKGVRIVRKSEWSSGAVTADTSPTRRTTIGNLLKTFTCCRKMIKDKQKTTKKTPPQEQLKELMEIPGVGKSVAADLLRIGIKSVADLKGKNPQALYDESNALARVVQDRCLLYTFRCAVYYANTVGKRRDPEKLKWWNWKDKKKTRLSGEF
jgi:hypothetical protein